MASAIFQIRLQGGGEMTAGHFGLGTHGEGVGTVRQQVHDGDTIHVRALGNFGVRFLGVDAPEMSFTLPGGRQFVSIGDPRWDEFLADPFAGPDGTAHAARLSAGLRARLQAGLGPGTAANHYRHAQAAQRALEDFIQTDVIVQGGDRTRFAFFLAFASEIMDRYGRLLAYVNRKHEGPGRPEDYNHRLLQAGVVSPYFIWPNVNPFRRQSNYADAVPEPGGAAALAEQEPTLRKARQWVRAARQARVGVFAEGDALRLQAFELRFLAGRRVPDRWLLDLGRADDRLVPPQEYPTVAHVEDRLFVPAEYVELFEKKGWRRGG